MPYFKEIFDYARTLDPQHRPLTYTNLMMAAAGKDKCHQFADVICLNRYYGWYVQDGYQLIGAKKAFINEMNQWMNTEPNKPFLFTEYGAALQRSGGIIRINGNDVVVAFLFGFQHFQGVGVIAGGNDAVRNFVLDQLCGGKVAHIRQGDPVTKAGHAVRTAGAGISAGQGRKLSLCTNMIHLSQRFVQWQANGGTGGGNMLKAGSSRLAQGFFQVAHQLVAVERIQKVDVARLAIQNGNGKIRTVCHKNAGRLLVGVGAVFQLEFIHKFSPPPCCICSGSHLHNRRFPA